MPEGGSAVTDLLRERGLSVIVPMYQEAATIPVVVPRLVEVLEGLGSPWELVLVDDGSTDATADVARGFAEKDGRIRVVTYRRNSGKGKAVKRGFQATTMGMVLTLDADLLTSTATLREYEARMRETGADVVAANKWHRDSSVGYGTQRHLLSKGFNLLVRTLFGLGLRDTQCGFKLYRREVLDACMPLVLSDRFAFEVELLAHARRRRFRLTGAPLRIDEVRSRAHSRVSAIEVLKMFKDVVLIFPRVMIANGESILAIWRRRNRPLLHALGWGRSRAPSDATGGK